VRAALIIVGAVLQFSGLAFIIAEVHALHVHEYNQVAV
jgi:hypothetical protein